MNKLIRRLLGTAAVLGATLSPQVHATVTNLDFEGDALTGLYFAGDSFSQKGFKMTADFDFGTVDKAAALGSVAPTGNASQFYFNSNDGGLIIKRDDGGIFDLMGFSAAFVPLSPPSSLTTVIVADAIDADGNEFGVAWLFASSATSNFPFANYSNPLDFAGFKRLRQVEFFACSLVGSSLCTAATRDSGQFALDNVLVTALPEPASLALVMFALLGLTVTARRSTR